MKTLIIRKKTGKNSWFWQGAAPGRVLASLVLAAALLAALPPGAWGDSQMWDRGAGTSDYNTPANWDLGLAVPGTNPGETAWFDMIGAGNVDISAATANPVRFDFWGWGPGSDYLVTALDGVHQELQEVIFRNDESSVTLATAGTGTYVLSSPTDFRVENMFMFATTTVSGVLTDGSAAGSLNIWGLPWSTLTLSGANTYSGGTTLSDITLAVGHDSALGSGGLNFNSGTLQAAAGGGPRTLANNVTVGGNFAFGGADDLTLSGTVDLGGATRTITLNNTGATIISGIISDGGLTTAGTGTLTLGGVNTYTGATTIGAGSTLALNATGSIAASSGVINNGTFSITGNKTIDSLSGSGATNLNGILTIGDATGTFCTYSGIANGAGGITKAGAGTLTLSGANTYTGDTTVTAGVLNLAAGGSITSNLNNWATTAVNGDVFGNVTNNVDAILRGNGTITGNLHNSGTVGPGNSVGTLNVVGSFSQDAGGILEVEIASAASFDKIVVTGAPGTAALAGTLKPVLLGGYTPGSNTLLKDVITATGGVTGTFNTVDSAVPCRVLYYANSIDLLLNMLAEEIVVTPPFNYADPSFSLTSNQRRIGYMFNAVNDSATGDLRAVMDLISQLPGGASVADAYQQISPDKAGALPAVSLAGSMMQWRTLANRLTYLRWRGGEAGGGESGLSPAFGRRGAGKMNLSYNNLSGLMLAYNGGSLGSLLSGKGKQADRGKRWGIYADFVGTIGNQGSSANQTGYDYQIFGFNSGVDYRLRHDLIIGAGSGYYHTATSFRGSGGSAEVNSIPFYAYGLYSPGSFYAMGSVGYTLNLYGLNRDLSFGGLSRTARSSVTGSQFNLSGETGYDVPLRGFIVTPAASLYYSKACVGGYTEKGADSLKLRVNAQNADSVQTGIGVRVTRPFKVKNAQVLPQASAFYQHEFANNSRGLDARLPQTGSNFSYTTVSPRRDFAVLGAGVAVGFKKNLMAQVNYNAEVGRGNSTTHYVSAGLRWEF